ncbi:hypothetical protein C0036_19505, partial [Streptomyces sp. DJ]
GGAEQGGAQQGGAEQGGAQQGGAEQGGAEQGGAQQGGAEQGGAQQGGAEQGGAQQGGSTTGGDTPASVGGGGDDVGTCILDEESVVCEDNTAPNGSAPQQVAQGEAKEELAETGAGQTTFLLVGAATMIAGGVAFRMMPNLVNRGTAA